MTEESQPEWLKLYLSGMTTPSRWYAVMENEVAAIIARPGGKYWSGARSVYSPSTQWLVHKGVTYGNDHRRVVWHGQWSNAKRSEMKAALNARERA